MNDQIILDKFSERLFKLVKENNTDINMLARILGIKSKSTIYRYMNGEMSPKITTIKYLAEYFNVNEIWLMGYDVPMKKNTNAESNVFPTTDIPEKVPIVGKISALSVTAFLSGIVSFIALVGSLPQLIGGEFNFDAPTIVALFFLITSALILFVTIGLGVSTLASTVKEANSYISPFMIVSMVLSLLPSFMDMSSIGYSFIPIMNICISMSSIIKGNFDLINIAITIIVNLIVTGLLVVLCAKLFNNERVIFSK